jgi:PAS domain S-box-containing protein
MPSELQSLKDSAELRAVTDSVRDYAIFLLDSSGRVLTWNTGAQQLKGYAPREIIGQNFERFYTEEDRAAGRPQQLLQIAGREGRVEDEGWRVRKDGSRFWANVVLSAIRAGDGGLRGYVKVTRDLTERKRAAQELEERARQQTAIADLGLYALQTRALDEVVQDALRVIRETLHVDDVRLLRGGEMPPEGSATVGIHSSDERPEPYGLLTVHPAAQLTDNDLTFLEAIANVVASAAARNLMEEQLRVAELEAVEQRGRSQQAQEALRERDEFISVAAHELRTPLTALQLKLQGLERGMVRDADKKSERLEGAVRQTERLSRLIDRLLDVSRIAQGRLELSPEEFDLAALVRQVAADFRDPAANARAPLELQLADKAEGTWDRLRIEQILVNLLSNAVKYGAGKPVAVKLEVKEDVVRLTIADCGIGIAPQDVSRIFARFQRAVPTRHYGGMGLGLYITRHIVEAHQGTISVESIAGQGATFVVELPRFAVVSAAGLHRVPQARM